MVNSALQTRRTTFNVRRSVNHVGARNNITRNNVVIRHVQTFRHGSKPNRPYPSVHTTGAQRYSTPGTPVVSE